MRVETSAGSALRWDVDVASRAGLEARKAGVNGGSSHERKIMVEWYECGVDLYD